MKVTRDGLYYKNAKEKANADCKVCPICGCKQVIFDGSKYVIVKLFPWTRKKKDCYYCASCNSKWESELYEFYIDEED